MISNLYAHHKITISVEEHIKIRLIDDGFVKICDMVNDTSIKVRTKASEMLHHFKNVDTKFLMQTLSKQIMSNLKVKPSFAEMEKQTQGQSIASQKKIVSLNFLMIKKKLFLIYFKNNINLIYMKSNPEGDTDVSGEEVSLLESGACGAFVHGLEDENSEVRLATIGYFFIFISDF